MRFMTFVRAHAKAIVALAATIAVTYLAAKGVHLDPDFEKAMEGVIVGVLVWAIPNRPPA